MRSYVRRRSRNRERPVIGPGAAQRYLDEWAVGSALSGDSRLASALAAHGPTTTKGAADIAVLLRQCLRADDVRRIGSIADRGSLVGAWLEMPMCRLFPETFDWADYGLLAQSTAPGRMRLSAQPWRPDWLDIPDGKSADGESSAALPCRTDETVPGDPFLNTIDRSFSGYKTPGQRAAVRSAMVLPAGATLVVNLPTGAGKTLAMLAAAEIAPQGMTSVIVVPTVALALDQERRYLAQNPGSPPVAYHGSLSDAAKKLFRERLWSGEQRVMFTNPEAVVSSLARPLAEAAAGGRLALLALDEAHVVGSWGDAFRPHFHTLAGLRRYMLRAAVDGGHQPFKTILASATLTEDVLRLLHALFGGPGPFFHVAAPVLRPEPEYWQCVEVDPDERQRRLLEALRHLPRPAIVYATLRQENRPGTYTAQQLTQVLRDAGFERVATVDGGSSTDHRERVLNGLRLQDGAGSTIDVVVATSAFGLGIDVPDVRTVVHACVPEGIDRFYQEVGRSGRDGNSSVSVLVATREDDDVASRLASPTYLTPERARERWTSMLNSARDAGEGLLRLPLTATSGKVKLHSDYNERWNLFTVLLLARAGAISWDFTFSDRDDADEADSDVGWLTVRVMRGDHGTDKFWETVVEPTRRSMVDSAREGLVRLRAAMTGTVCTGVVTAESFTIDTPPDWRATCLAACGGCRWCRAHDRTRWASPSPMPAAIAVQSGEVALEKLGVNGAFGPRLAIFVDEGVLSSPRKLARLVANVVATAGIRLIVASERLLASIRDIVSKSPTLVRSVMVDSVADFDPITAVGVPTLIVLASREDAEEWLQGNSRSPMTVVCGTADTPVGNTGLVLRDVDGCYAYSDFENL